MIRVLFTGGGGAGSEALARFLADRYEVHFADADPDAKPHGIADDRWHVIPLARDPGFRAGLDDLIRRIAADHTLLGVDEEVAATLGDSRWDETFHRTHLDKLESMRVLGLAVTVPRTESAESWLRPPCIVKPRFGRGSRGVRVVRTTNELRAHLLLAGEECVLQEYLEGDEYTVTVAADRDGNLRAVVPCKVSVKRGVTIRATTHYDPAVIDICERIHAAHPVPGCYNVQGIKTVDGLFMPFEINPRVSTTLCLAIAAGVDPIGIYLGHYPGEGLLPFENGLTLKRSWHNEFTSARVPE